MKIDDGRSKPRTIGGSDLQFCGQKTAIPESGERRALDFPALAEAWRQHEATVLLAFIACVLARSER